MTVSAAFEIDVGKVSGQATLKPVDASGAIGSSGADRASGAAGAIRTRALEPGRSPALSGIAAPESFRSSWQRIVAVLDNSAAEETSAPAVSGRLQTAFTGDPAVRSLLSANLPHVEMPSRSRAEPIQSPETQLASASATLGRANEVSQNEADPEAVEGPASGETPTSVHSVYAKQSLSTRPATEKAAQSQSGPPYITDAAIALASQAIGPAQPVVMARIPVGSVPQSSLPSEPGPMVSAHQAAGGTGPGTRVSVSSEVAQEPDSEPSLQNAVDPLPEAPVFASGISSALHPVRADHSPGKPAETPAATAAGAIPAQPAESPQSSSGRVPAESIAPPAANDGVTGSPSSVSDANASRPQSAAARTAAGAESVRVNHADSQPNLAAVEGMHSQLNGATPDSAAIRDTVFAGASNSGQGSVVQTPSGVSTAETFSALDGANGSISLTWTHAAPHHAEAGFEDPSLGWVSVRAGLNAGSISAVVVPASADATEALGAHMAGLHGYLADRHSPVESVDLATAQNSGADAGWSQGMQHQNQQQSGQNSPANAQTSNAAAEAPTAAPSFERTRLSGDESPAVLQAQGGRYISVMA